MSQVRALYNSLDYFLIQYVSHVRPYGHRRSFVVTRRGERDEETTHSTRRGDVHRREDLYLRASAENNVELRLRRVGVKGDDARRATRRSVGLRLIFTRDERRRYSLFGDHSRRRRVRRREFGFDCEFEFDAPSNQSINQSINQSFVRSFIFLLFL